ncbi:MAG TPA: hypothetical protein VLA25_02595 [Methylotenera sp.]|nr:hypothetical protein [Methylotenera sp.]
MTVEPLFKSFNALFTERGGTVDGLNQIQSAAERGVVSLQKAAYATSGLNTANLDLKISQDAINESFARSAEPLQQFVSYLESMGLTFDEISKKAIPNFNTALADGLGVFAEFAKKGITSFRDLAKGVITASAAIVRSLIRQGVIAAVANAFKSAPGPLGIALGLAAAGLAEGLFNGLLSKFKVPAFASGGIVSGPTLGLVGEYPGARTNPEVIAPLDKLKKIIGGGGNGGFIAETVISGSDLRVILSRADKTYTRYTTG